LTEFVSVSYIVVSASIALLSHIIGIKHMKTNSDLLLSCFRDILGGFVKTGRDVYRKVQGRDHPPHPAIINLTGDGGGAVLTKREEEERRIAELGRPALGEHARLEVVIEESYEFKVGAR
ncbi:sodium/calcium exchanger 1-like, partial [Etheostoma cragini]|uniref:sodium/calcium exchanger 1-like n=1 Tax=Etheostoma cragini TaxID=417921 RepID=UPI00155F167E